MSSYNRGFLSLDDNSPDSLFDICMDYIVLNLNVISKFDPSCHFRLLKDDVMLPVEICEKFLQAYQKKNSIEDNIANLFRDTTRTRLDSIKLRKSHISDEGLWHLMEHNPYELELVECEYLSSAALEIINCCSENLISLKLGPMTYIVGQNETLFRPRGYIIEAPKLRKLTIHYMGLAIFPDLLLKPLTNLSYLDLSDCTSGGNICDLQKLTTLKTLILHNVDWTKEVTEWISSLHNLHHLDISQSNDMNGRYQEPNEVLAKIVTSLPLLEKLDISGTNLEGSEESDEDLERMESGVRCDIPGLVSRVNRPLEFLGLYGTHHAACKRRNIPAKIISGNANEEQILTAAAAYLERPLILTRVLIDLFLKYENSVFDGRALVVVLDAMEHHVADKTIQICCSAILFHLVKGRNRSCIDIKLKKRIITALLDGMESHFGEDTMMQNGCLTLCQFRIPDDLLFENERVVQILVNGVNDVNQDAFLQIIAIDLINSLDYQVEG